MARDKWKRLSDLFVRGRHVNLPDGSHLWVQVLNTYERDDCISAAQVSRARLVMALRNKGEEQEKVLGHITEVGTNVIARELADVKVEDIYFRLANQIRDDPDWKERIRILDETNPETQVLTEEEQELVTKLQEEFIVELDVRRQDERELALHDYQAMSDEELEEEYLKAWLDKKGSVAGQKEFNLWEVAYCTHYCEEDGEVEPGTCHARGERVFENAAAVRHVPQELQDIIRETLNDLSMSERDPKALGSPQASSDSSPTPSEPGESTPSTSTETPPTPRGTSSRQSVTA